MGRRRGPGAGKKDPATDAFEKGCALVQQHRLFGPLFASCRTYRVKGNYCPDDAWAVVLDNADIHVHPSRRGEPAEWARVLAHCVLHLALEHFRYKPDGAAWNAAACCAAERMLTGMKFGRIPEEMLSPELPARAEESLYEEFRTLGIPKALVGLSTGGAGRADLWFVQGRAGTYTRPGLKSSWSARFSAALQSAVEHALEDAAGARAKASSGNTPGGRARRWFIDHFPLLGSLAMAFEIVEDSRVLYGKGISVAAVDPQAKTIWIHSDRLDELELRFVMAHELLHVGLRHDTRRQGRDAFLWNVACDFVINGWLIEMGIGELPKIGALHDPELKGLSAEAIYDRIVTDVRAARKLATFRGQGVGDLLEGDAPDWWAHGEGMTLDELYRRCLVQGLALHEDHSRGLLPAGMVEEIRALAQPPIPWDVELARWFDQYFTPPEKRRSYARPSRRQSSTPDIPRPSWTLKPGALDARTFGVVMDTSGSMWMTGSRTDPSEKHVMLRKALGSIASYAMSREVPRVRLVFCDAEAYDQGYVAPEEIAERRVNVKGLGGTVLQPGIDLLEKAHDFPADGPILIITDGECDRLHLKRDHAFLMPEGRSLPFVPKGRVFRVS